MCIGFVISVCNSIFLLFTICFCILFSVDLPSRIVTGRRINSILCEWKKKLIFFCHRMFGTNYSLMVAILAYKKCKWRVTHARYWIIGKMWRKAHHKITWWRWYQSLGVIVLFTINILLWCFFSVVSSIGLILVFDVDIELASYGSWNFLQFQLPTGQWSVSNGKIYQIRKYNRYASTWP